MPSKPRSIEQPTGAPHVVVNGTARRVTARTLQALLAELGFTSPFIGTAVNGELVRRDERGGHPIVPGDRVEILTPMQGG